MDNFDSIVATLERAGYRVIRDRDTPDERLRELWDDAIKRLRMAEDIASEGARLHVNHPAYLPPKADVVGLLRSALVGKIDTILKRAVVVREEQDAS